jgi:hypothetical protein
MEGKDRPVDFDRILAHVQVNKRWSLLDIYEEQFKTDRAIQYK